MIVLMLVCFLIVLLLFSWIPILNRQGFNVTGPLPLPLIGNGHLFLVKSTEYLNVLNDLSKTFGDAYLVYFFTFPYVVLSHPKFIEEIVILNVTLARRLVWGRWLAKYPETLERTRVWLHPG